MNKEEIKLQKEMGNKFETDEHQLIDKQLDEQIMEENKLDSDNKI